MTTPPTLSRRDLLRTGATVALASALPRGLHAAADPAPEPASARPQPADRRFRSDAVEQFLTDTRARIADPELAQLFVNCFPNTLDTTVEPGTFEGKPDTAVITGDIPAMWQRDSSAQVWPYLPLARNDDRLRSLIEGVIRRQTRHILIDPYANAFMADLSAPPLEWSRHDQTDMKPGVGERKYELDSLCYPIRLAHGFWKQTGATQPFDSQWRDAMRVVLRTMREQQRKTSLGPYHFQRSAPTPTETLGEKGFGNPVNPVGLIVSSFRPSDDACIFPFLVPSNLFAVTSLRQLAEMASAILHDPALADDASTLSDEVEAALRQHAVVSTPEGAIWAYEVDGFGGHVLMDDTNVPSLLALPYLNSSPDEALYRRTRAFVWSERNPWFYQGSAGRGVGGPHVGANMIWPMSQTIYALTSNSPAEIREMLHYLKIGSAGTGFIHESYYKDDPKQFTRAWFAWANTLFGELIANLARTHPDLLQA
ncbi:glycoside hydrolase family 125 protein [Acidobacteria bacterium AB60]|nr:glycoside hydrolase family 125 protein [Acidobacteria bacterium AB60]